MNCIFCEIISGNIPSYTIYEDEIVKVFLDVNPDCNGHCLIVPKKHTLDFDTIDLDSLNHIMVVSKKMKTLIESKFNTHGFTFVQNNGAVQEVKHFHLHLKPYYKEKQELMDIKDVYDILKA